MLNDFMKDLYNWVYSFQKNVEVDRPDEWQHALNIALRWHICSKGRPFIPFLYWFDFDVDILCFICIQGYKHKIQNRTQAQPKNSTISLDKSNNTYLSLYGT